MTYRDTAGGGELFLQTRGFGAVNQRRLGPDHPLIQEGLAEGQPVRWVRGDGTLTEFVRAALQGYTALGTLRTRLATRNSQWTLGVIPALAPNATVVSLKRKEMEVEVEQPAAEAVE